MVEGIDDPAFGLDISLLQNGLDILGNAKSPPQRRTLPRRVELVGVIRRRPAVREQTAVLVHELRDGLRQSPADAIGVDIDPRGECRLELCRKVLGAIVDAPGNTK